MIGAGFGRVGEKTDGRVTWENEFIPRNYYSIKARIDHQSEMTNGTAFVPSVILHWPGTQWTLIFVIEQRIQKDNHATFTELSFLF